MPDNFDRRRRDNCPPCRCDRDRWNDRRDERRDDRRDRRDDRWDRRDDRNDNWPW